MGNAPLFPAPRDDSRPIRRDTVAKWVLKAEKLAGLPKLVGGVFHPYRRLWATERKSLPDRIEGEGREGVAGGSTQASRVACAEDVPGSGSDPDGVAPAGGGDAVPVPEPEQILAYCGLGVVMRSSSDWVRGPGGRWVREPVQQTRGLNRNFNHTLKRVFKGAATTVIGRAENEPLYRHYERLLEGGTKPNLAKLTIARQLASIVLAVWRTGEAYDPKRLEATE